MPRLHEVGVDGGVILFTSAVSLARAASCPDSRRRSAWAGGDVFATLKDATRAAGASALWGRGANVRRVLVTLELALSVVLLIGAALLLRSFAQLQRTPPGFNPDGVLTFELTMSGRRYDDAWKGLETYRELWRRLATLPGVTASGGISALPLSQMFAWGPITVEGRVPEPGEEFINVDMRFAAAGYFPAMEIPLRRGRLFDERDTRDQPRVAIVDEQMARVIWPGADAIGKRFRMGSDPKAPWHTVVGVVGRIKQYTLDTDSRIAAYFPHTQYPIRAMNVVLRTDGDPAALRAPVARTVAAVAADLPIYNLRTMARSRRRVAGPTPLLDAVARDSAALAMGLAAIGIYGVMSYIVQQGTRELGIRMALGATPMGIVSLVVRHGLVMTVAGIASGVAGAWQLSRFVESLLFGVSAVDPLTFIATPLFLGAVALVASLVPAGRAARIDPVEALRTDA